MNPEERTVADYAGTGVTVGRHPVAYCRARLRDLQVFRAGDLKRLRHGVKARIAGQVIALQRPGTAHGFIFLSLEDETGIAHAIVDPDLYEADRSLVTYAKFLLIKAISRTSTSSGKRSSGTLEMKSHDQVQSWQPA